MKSKLARYGLSAAALAVLGWTLLPGDESGSAPGAMQDEQGTRLGKGRVSLDAGQQLVVDGAESAHAGGDPASLARSKAPRRELVHGVDALPVLLGHDQAPTGGVVRADGAAVDSEVAWAALPPGLRRSRELVEASSPRTSLSSLTPKQGPRGTEISSVGSTVRATSHRHVVEFHVQGLKFTPKGEDGVPRQAAAVGFALEAAGRESQLESIDLVQAPEVEDTQVRYQRTPELLEHYLLFDDGVEQLFSFARLPVGEGDLVIRGRVDTALEGRETERGGVVFEGAGEPTVRFGKVRACDGKGRTIDVDLALAGDVLEIRLPGAWIDEASAPLLVDPLIDQEQAFALFPGHDDMVDITYSATRDEFLMAFVNSDDVVAVSRLSGTGRVIVNGMIVDSSATTKSWPTVSWSEAGVDRYLIAYGRDSELWFAVLDDELGVISSPARILDFVGFTEIQNFPSAAYDPSRNRWGLVWDDNSTSASTDILIGLVGTDGSIPGVYLLRDLTNPLYQAEIAYSQSTDCFLVVYTDNTNFDILGSVVNGAVTSIWAQPTISNATSIQYMPAVCWNSVDDEFWVGWQSFESGTSWDVFAKPVTPLGVVGAQISVANTAEYEGTPRLAFQVDSETVLAVFNRTDFDRNDVWSREFDASGTAVTPQVEVSTLYWDAAGYYPVVATNTARSEWLVCWEDLRSGTDYDVWGRRVGSDTGTPHVVRFYPSNDSTDVLIDQSYATVEFSHDMDSSTINTTNLVLYQGVTPITTASVMYLAQGRLGLISISGDWPTSQSIRVHVSGNVETTAGVAMGTAAEATFYTGTSTTLPDSDFDGLLDVEEAAYGTDPNDDDADGDGLSDWWELFYSFTDPNNDDTDGDGLTDDIDTDPTGSPGDHPNVPPADLAATFEVTQIVPTGTLGAPAETSINPTIAVSFNNAVDQLSVTSGNLTVEDQVFLSNVPLTVLSAPNDRTVLVEPSIALTPGRLYKITVSSGVGAIEDSDGNTVSTTATSYFTVDTPAADPYEPPHNDATLALTDWERFPLLAPTASGRMGVAYVVPSTRKLFLAETDVATPGRGITVEITRVHRNNDDAASGMFGNNWHFTYDRSFTCVADQNSDTYRELEHRTGDGRLFTYASQSSSVASSYLSPPGFHDTLKVVNVGGDDLLVQRTKHGMEYFYEFHQPGNTSVEDPDSLPLGAVGYLVRIQDANGNVVVINRAAANHATRPNRIESIVDDLDRTTTFTYSVTSGQEDLCVEVEQFDGSPTTRSWLYNYDGNGSLQSVSTPESDYLDEGSPVSSTRKSRYYSYTSSGGVYSLTSMDDGRANTSFRVLYDDARDVRQVDFGDGNDAGTALYSYRRVSGVNEATQIDRNGNVLVLEHDDTSTPYWTISSQRIYTRGLHPNAPGGEPASYLTVFTHDSDMELVEVENTNLLRMIRDAKGNVLQLIRKAATPAELSINGANYKREEDIIVEFAYEPDFNRVIRMTEPRGNNAAFVGTSSTIVSSTESVASQTPRTFSASDVDEVKRNAYTKFFYYDHENVSSRLSADTTAIGDTVSLVRQLPKSYGRTAANATRDPPDSAFNDVDGDGFPDRGGNLYVMRDGRPYAVDRTTGAFGASRQVIEHAYTYNQWGQRVLEILPDDNTHRLEYHVGSFNLSTNPGRGYVKKRVVATEYTDLDLDLNEGDPASGPSGTGLELTTTFSYDVFGNVVSVQDPRGNTWSRQVNLLNLVTRTTTPYPFEYDVEHSHDGNNNLVEIRIENIVAVDSNDDGLQDVGEQAVVGAHPEFVHSFRYSTANMLVQQDLDAYGSDPSVVTTTFAYDRKQLRVGMREHEGNTHVWRYDERDLVYEAITGANDTSVSATIKYDYDHNRNLVQVLDDDGNLNPALTLTYDVFDRATAVVDELGNELETTFDVGGFPRQEVLTGLATGAPLESPTTLLSNTMFEYDEIGRQFQRSQELFNGLSTLSSLGISPYVAPVDVSSKLLAGGEIVSETICFGKCSCEKGLWDAMGNPWLVDQDAADRNNFFADPEGSEVYVTFDNNSNPIRLTEVEVSDDGLTTETYAWEQFFDEQNRVIATVSHLGNTHRYLYDSRGNVIQSSDAMGALIEEDLTDLLTAEEHGTFPQFSMLTPAANPYINHRGNTVRHTFDGLGRALSTVRDMRVGGVGSGDVLLGQEIVTSQTWDGNGRLRSQTDPNGNTTSYGYDAQNRRSLTTFADGSYERLLWGRLGTVVSRRDPRGVVTTYTHDAAEQRVAAAFSGPLIGQEQTTFVNWRYDGLGRMTRAEDNDSIVELEYDSLSRQVRELQSIATGAPRVSAAQSLAGAVTGDMRRIYDATGNLVRQTYPSNTVFNRTYDEVNRLASVTDAGGTIATFSHIGGGARRLSRHYDGPDITTSYAYDGNRQITRLDHVVDASSQRVRGFTYAWDRAGNRRYERRLTVNTNPSEVGGPGEFYQYDSMYRLVHEDRDVTSSALDSVGHNTTTVTAPTPVASQASDYVYDPAGNRRHTVIDTNWKVYEMRIGGNEFDAALNQYSKVGSAVQTHDANGNVLSSSETGLQRFFDGQDQLVQWTDATKDVRYRYDALGRRISKRMVAGGSTWTLFFYDGWQCVEETTSGGVVTRRYVFGEGIDEVLRATLVDVLDLDGDLSTGDMVDLHYHENSLGSIVALTKSNGSVVESYRYDAWGNPTIYDQSGTPVSTTQVEQPFMFTGRRLDWEEGSGLYYYRLRYYDPAAGRFVSHDPIGRWGDPSQGGNGQNYCANNPANYVDPFGDTSSRAQGPGYDDQGSGSTPVTGRTSEAFRSWIEEYRKHDPITAGELLELGLFVIDALLLEVTIVRLAAVECGGAVGTRVLQFFYHNVDFREISKLYWRARGGAFGRSLHHWLIPQRWTWIPRGFRNAGWNLINLPAFRGVFHRSLGLNQWMGFALRWGWKHRLKAQIVENSIRVIIPGSAYCAWEIGWELGTWVGGILDRWFFGSPPTSPPPPPAPPSKPIPSPPRLPGRSYPSPL